MPNDDIALLHEYARNNSEAAFSGLVSRHVNLVYSVALRQVRSPQLAEEITQAVFIILARKADKLLQHAVLAGWLCRTARYASANALTIQRRRQRREQEAYMQNILTGGSDASSPQLQEETWFQIAPLLDGAMDQLGRKDHDALVLRFFEGRNYREVGAALGASEDAAKMRVNRALEKLRKFFTKRGISSTTAILAGAISANSVQAAPVTLAKAVTATVFVKGAAASGSTVTLIRGALKLMAWTKAKTAIVASVVVLLAVGTTTVTVREIHEHRTYPWQVQNANSDVLRKVPPQVGIAPARYPNTMGAGSVWINDGESPSSSKTMGIAQSLESIVSSAYSQSDERTVFLTKVASSKFDYIANLPSGNKEALQKEIKRKFGLVAQRETRDTDTLLLEVKNPTATGLKSADPHRLEPHSGSSSRSGAGYIVFRNQPLSNLAWSLEYRFKTAVINQTGLTNLYDIDLNWDETDFQHPNLDGLKQALLDQLGLELVPTNMPIEMLVVEKAQ